MAINVIRRDALDNKNGSIKASSLGTQCQRVANVALPFLAMYKPFGFAVGAGSGAMRVLANVSNLTTAVKNGDKKDITFQMIQTAIAVASIASTLIAHPIGMLITTVNDVALDAFHMIKFIKDGEYQKAAEKSFSILSNAVYLGVMLGGGIELSIASIALQILNGIYQSRNEFMKGNYLEAFGHVAIVGIKSHQMAGQIQTLQSKWKFEALLKELSEKHKAQESQPKPTKKMLGCIKQTFETDKNLESKVMPNTSIMLKEVIHEEFIEVLMKYKFLANAVYAQDINAVKLFLENKADPNIRSEIGKCCYYDYINRQKFFNEGMTPLDVAVYIGNIDITTLLLKFGADATLLRRVEFNPKDTNTSDQFGYIFDLRHCNGQFSPIYWALVNKNHNILRAFSFYHADFNKICCKSQEIQIKPLDRAIDIKDKEAVKILIEGGAIP